MYACISVRGDNHRYNGKTKKKGRCKWRGLPRAALSRIRAGLRKKVPTNSHNALAAGLANLFMISDVFNIFLIILYFWGEGGTKEHPPEDACPYVPSGDRGGPPFSSKVLFKEKIDLLIKITILEEKTYLFINIAIDT